MKSERVVFFSCFWNNVDTHFLEQNLEAGLGFCLVYTNSLFLKRFFFKMEVIYVVTTSLIFMRNLGINRCHYLSTSRKIETEFKRFSSIDCKTI